ncbi:hypothetical protein HWV62_12478 [Athelia sp. TMB]|nr:hypothetical protein HWV62_12478 [Athelia sp. TMB]
MHAESTKIGRRAFLLPLDSFHDAEGLPIPSPFDSHPEQPKIVTSHGEQDELHSNAFPSPDLDQKISQHLLAVEEEEHHHHLIAQDYDFYPSSPAAFDDDDVGMSPAAMFLSSFSPMAAAPMRLPDDEGETVAGYTLGPIIGHGASSIIRRASSTSGGTVAIKIVRRSDLAKQSQPALARKRLDREVSIWSSLSHEHILPLFTTVRTPHADFFVTLYCPAGTLFDILKRDGRPALPQDDAGMMFRQVVRGLRYLHEVARLVHRDIKLENVLVDEMGVCRIGDFGMSRNIGDLDADDEDQPHLQQESDRAQGLERRATFVQHKKPMLPHHGPLSRHLSTNLPRHRNSTTSASPGPPSHVFQPGSLPYAAPEILTPNPVPCDPSQDIWALGVMLYAMLAGRLPFTDSFEPRLQMKILHGVYDMPAGIGRSAELVLKGCIDRSLVTRWNIAMVDDLAWGVGWGDAEESGTPSHEEEVEILTRAHRSASQSRTRSRSRASRLECSKHTTPITVPAPAPYSLDAPRRRSASRRSQSRTSTSSRSASRHSPQYAALAESCISTDSASSVPFDRHYESALLTSPAPVRGRLPKKAASRSPSPSAAPATPSDFMRGHPLPPLEDVVEGEPARGRRAFARAPSPTRPRADSDAWSAGSLSVEAPHRRSLLSGQPRRAHPAPPYVHFDVSRSAPGAARAESTPPVKEDGSALRQGRGFLCDSTPSPSLLTPLCNTPRSRSAGG